MEGKRRSRGANRGKSGSVPVKVEEDISSKVPEPVARSENGKMGAVAQIENPIYNIGELEPYFDKAKPYIVSPESTKPPRGNADGTFVYKTKNYQIDVNFNDQEITSVGIKEPNGLPVSEMPVDAKMGELTILSIDFGDNNPLVKGEALFFITSREVFSYFFDKSKGEVSPGLTRLSKEGLSQGTSKVGVDITKESIALIVVPDAGATAAQVEFGLVNNEEYRLGRGYTGIFGVNR
jgi:hypothetical protein